MRFILLILLFAQTVFSQKSAPGWEIACPQDTLHALPTEILNLQHLRIASNPTARFRTVYHKVPEETIPAIEAALNTWEQILISQVPITIHIFWEELEKNTLASAGPDKVFKNFKNAPLSHTWYPSALAEAISRTNLNGNEPDIKLRINKKINWNLNVNDPLSSIGTYDLYSVILHEIAHGIGFMSSFKQDANTVQWGIDNVPYIYDLYIIDTQKFQLTNNRFYTNASDILKEAVTIKDVFFAIDSGAYHYKSPKLHTENPFKPGVSLSHLASDRYTLLDPNDRLMYYALNWNTKIRTPGNGILAILYQMGWAINHFDFSRVYPLDESIFKISIYPNPASTEITLETNQISKPAQLIDVWGRVYLNISINNTQSIIPITSLRPGLYYLKIQNRLLPFIKI